MIKKIKKLFIKKKYIIKFKKSSKELSDSTIMHILLYLQDKVNFKIVSCTLKDNKDISKIVIICNKSDIHNILKEFTDFFDGKIEIFTFI